MRIGLVGKSVVMSAGLNEKVICAMAIVDVCTVDDPYIMTVSESSCRGVKIA